MKKNYFLILTFWAFGLSVLAQSEGYYYWYKGEQIPLVLNLSTVNIVTTPQFQAGVLSRMGFDVISELNDNAGLQPLKVVQAVFSIASDRTSYNRSVAGLRNLDGVVSVAPWFERGADVAPIGTSHLFYVKLKQEGDLALLTQLAEQQGVQIVKQNEFMPLWYRLSVTGNSAGDAVQMANAFYETGLFEEIDPAFMFNFQSNCTNDPMFDQLWGLQNRTYGYDINACRAWTILMDMG